MPYSADDYLDLNKCKVLMDLEGRQGGLGTTPFCQIKMKIKKNKAKLTIKHLCSLVFILNFALGFNGMCIRAIIDRHSLKK